MNDNYNIKVFSHIYPLIRDFLFHYTSYKQLHSEYLKLPGEREFWVLTCDSHLKTAVTSWCMIFGSTKTNKTHWKNVFDDYTEDVVDEFRKYLSEFGGINNETWEKCWYELTSFRNKYVAHRELGYANPVPHFDIALQVVILFDKWIRVKIEPDYLDIDNMEELMIEYKEKVRQTLLCIQNINSEEYQNEY